MQGGAAGGEPDARVGANGGREDGGEEVLPVLGEGQVEPLLAVRAVIHGGKVGVDLFFHGRELAVHATGGARQDLTGFWGGPGGGEVT